MKLLYNFQQKLKTSDILKRVIRAIIFGIGGSAGSRFLLVISGIVISRIIGKELYGQFAMINNTVHLFVAFSGTGIGATLTRYVSYYRNDKNKLESIIGTLSIFVTVISLFLLFGLFFFSKALSFYLCGSDILKRYLQITAFTIFFSALSSIQRSILIGFEGYKLGAKTELITYTVYLIVSPILSLLYSIYGAVVSLFILEFFKSFLFYLQNRKIYISNNIKIRYGFDQEIKKIIYQFTVPVFISSLFVLPVDWINNSILARYAGFGELAIVSASVQWMTILTYLPLQMSQLKPIYTDLFKQKKYSELRKLFNNVTISSVSLVLPFAFFGICFSKFILKIYGTDYNTGYMTFIFIMIAAVLITSQSQIGPLLQAMGKMWLGFCLNLIWSLVIVGVFFNLRYLGSMGYAIAYCVAYGIHSIISHITLIILLKRAVVNAEN